MTAPLPTRVFSITAPVLLNREVGPGLRRLALRSKEIARTVRPGQFVNLVPGAGLDPLLPRPFSIFRVEGDVVEFLIQVVGKGTAALARIEKGDRLACFGPLGRGFDIPKGHDIRHLMVAGGIGVAPFWALGKALQGDKRLLYGAATPKHLVCLGEFRKTCGKVETISVQGGTRRGFVTELLLAHLAMPAPIQIYACGPTPMLKAVWRIALERSVPCQLSLETPMACGMGLCKGCSFPRRGEPGYTLTCREGPVYEAAAVDFDHPAVCTAH